ncbi:hypothetical protein SP28804_2012 [Streptococcus pneumoniae CDC0288-04]|nr:hypothetical protein SPP_2198 [Streptococcus pneumoniae P1031]EDT94504.1 hypothetical protein SP28804_2012 [Streptococcus pneumoniae CDC0288-04]EHD84093.1 hypothetical protein SPAR30_2123 [Streptococcus pneumoniae GA13455]EHD90729.1 hypothetical protein SPAR32_2230 [Streptococcus pneumoniae GA13637]EHE00769.1 hypothetical protein SPAR41_2348 [Streptococcus pneumoniae GA16833]EHZ27767.1 hypothetical protein SPAR51_2157 [Streptococcus pneumoniae GA17719]EJG41980.1 hypothetical protein AMCSP1
MTELFEEGILRSKILSLPVGVGKSWLLDHGLLSTTCG